MRIFLSILFAAFVVSACGGGSGSGSGSDSDSAQLDDQSLAAQALQKVHNASAAIGAASVVNSGSN